MGTRVCNIPRKKMRSLAERSYRPQGHGRFRMRCTITSKGCLREGRGVFKELPNCLRRWNLSHYYSFFPPHMASIAHERNAFAADSFENAFKWLSTAHPWQSVERRT